MKLFDDIKYLEYGIHQIIYIKSNVSTNFNHQNGQMTDSISDVQHLWSYLLKEFTL